MNRELCLVICFFVGVLAYHLLKSSCGCNNVVEGASKFDCSNCITDSYGSCTSKSPLSYTDDTCDNNCSPVESVTDEWDGNIGTECHARPPLLSSSEQRASMSMSVPPLGDFIDGQ